MRAPNPDLTDNPQPPSADQLRGATQEDLGVEEALGTADAIGMVVALLERYALTVPDDASVNITSISKWQDPDGKLRGIISINMAHEDLDPAQRRALKRDFTLEVPSWQLDTQMDHKDLTGQADMGGWRVVVTVRQAYVCEVVGEIEDEPSEYQLDEADAIESLTNEQVLYLHALKVAQMRQPTVRKRFRCVPADTLQETPDETSD